MSQLDLQLIEESIQNLELSRSTLLQQLATLDAQLVSEKTKHAHLLNQHAPIHSLPNELLALIFTDTHSLLRSSRSSSLTADIDALKFLTETSRVCVRWRQIILDTPLLWNSLVMTVTPGFNHHLPAQAYLLTHLARSDDAFLDLSIYAETADPADLRMFFEMIALHAHRWRRVSLEMRLADVDLVKNYLAHLSCPLLRHFSIRTADSPHGRSHLSPRTQFPEVHAPQIFKLGAPKLSSLRLANDAIGNLHPPLTHLHTLHLGGWDHGFFLWPHLKSLLESIPNLRNLSLHELCVRSTTRDPTAHPPLPIRLPALRSLRLHKPFTPFDQILPLLCMPQLRNVTMHDTDNFDCAVVPTVTRLVLDCCALQEHHAERLVAAFPNVQHLTLDDAAYAVYDPGLLATPLAPTTTIPSSSTHDYVYDHDHQPPAYPWPHLASLTMRNMPATDVATFALTILKRKVDSYPIQHVYLDRRTRGVVRAKGKLELLTDNAVVGVVGEEMEVWPPSPPRHEDEDEGNGEEEEEGEGVTYYDPHDLV